MLCAAIRRIQQRKHELLGYAISLFIALCIGIANFLSRLAWRALDLYNDAADSTQLAVQQASTADRLLRDSTAASTSPFRSVPFDASIAGGAAAVALLPGMFQQFTKKVEELETMNAQYLEQQGSLLQQVSEMNTKLEKLGEATIETNTKLEKLSETNQETNDKLGETNAKLEKLGETNQETNDKLGETNAKLGKLSSQLEELRLQQHGLSCPHTTGGWCDGT
jgi:methyl-accepting chemotaxis protein